MDITFNINEEVFVKLTDYGIDEWINHYNRVYPPNHPYLLTREKVLEKKLENGYWKFQLWDLMDTFGHLMYIGGIKIPFETNIIIPVKLDRKNKIEILLNGN